MDTLLNGSGLLYAALGIGFVIFIHELGHFLAAKKAGVRVHIFSIGFGPVIWRKTVGETDYQLSLLPFGGYVAMQVESDADGRGMADKGAWWRAAILFAGVFFNLVSSFLILLCLYWYGMPHIPPVVGDIHPKIQNQDGVFVDSPATQLGLLPGDEILEINGRHMSNFQEVAMMGTDSIDGVVLQVQRGDKTLTLPAADAAAVKGIFDIERGHVRIGIGPASSNKIFQVLGSAAGVEAGWRVTKVNGVATPNWGLKSIVSSD